MIEYSEKDHRGPTHQVGPREAGESLNAMEVAPPVATATRGTSHVTTFLFPARVPRYSPSLKTCVSVQHSFYTPTVIMHVRYPRFYVIPLRSSTLCEYELNGGAPS
ncbi:hypothetical protein CC1G_15270 [Coprinopsis cinerea okayama7|uniref:Uncharacterized protein n=1 Tax=Coprinopsis cinerea (strain Okayama-7 / 130 / ATCC MYA-4618 / FGSC 9003) TaxID=240176 RepID=D6RPW9_COPC7|nr:hypothetical protein CC1G_15270 [Coprinopsis cinerea okayama7\|eukprot:XP_002910362.1 hypothetical protein CC1G_15270 [Coprinopsis cinerea okayama7\